MTASCPVGPPICAPARSILGPPQAKIASEGCRRRSSPTTAAAWSSPLGSKAVKRMGFGPATGVESRAQSSGGQVTKEPNCQSIKRGTWALRPESSASCDEWPSLRRPASEARRGDPRRRLPPQRDGDAQKRFDTRQVRSALDGAELAHADPGGLGEVLERPAALRSGQSHLTAQFVPQPVLRALTE